MKALITALLLVPALSSANAILLEQREYPGDYQPDMASKPYEGLGDTIRVSTTAPAGMFSKNKYVTGIAAFSLYATPQFYPWGCTVTKQVCMLQNIGCQNQMKRYLVQQGSLLDTESFWSTYAYGTEGTYLTTSTIFMDQCGGSKYTAKSIGAVKIV
jgi:hypothetical protein